MHHVGSCRGIDARSRVPRPQGRRPAQLPGRAGCWWVSRARVVLHWCHLFRFCRNLDAIPSLPSPELGIQKGGQTMVAFLLFVNDVHGMGLKVAQGLQLLEAFYLDMARARRLPQPI